jgi:hypothetical protein
LFTDGRQRLLDRPTRRLLEWPGADQIAVAALGGTHHQPNPRLPRGLLDTPSGVEFTHRLSLGGAAIGDSLRVIEKGQEEVLGAEIAVASGSCQLAGSRQCALHPRCRRRRQLVHVWLLAFSRYAAGV